MAAEINRYITPSNFGRGKFTGSEPELLGLPLGERVQVLAWWHACPRPAMVVKAYGEEWLKSPDAKALNPTPEQVREHGERMTLQRYSECNFVFTHIICDFAQKHNLPLHEELTRPIRRLPTEPMGILERNRVPLSHAIEESPLSSLKAYALSRVFIEGTGRGNDRTDYRYYKTMDVLEELVRTSKTSIELLARLSEAVIQSEGYDKIGADSLAVLSHVLEPGILDEENNHVEYFLVAEALAQHAPKLWKIYQSLSSGQRAEKGIVELPTKLKTFPWDGKRQEVIYSETEEVAEGVTCDVYTFAGDSSKDLGIIKIQAGKSTSLQLVIGGDRTIEGHIFGKGRLVVNRRDGPASIIEVGEDPYNPISITVHKGDTMRWQANPDSSLMVFEICYPPYQEGRYTNLT